MRQETLIAASGEPITLAQVAPSSSNAAGRLHWRRPPTFFKAPPKGIMFDYSDEQIARPGTADHAWRWPPRMMPLGNRTGMTDEERDGRRLDRKRASRLGGAGTWQASGLLFRASTMDRKRSSKVRADRRALALDRRNGVRFRACRPMIDRTVGARAMAAVVDQAPEPGAGFALRASDLAGKLAMRGAITANRLESRPSAGLDKCSPAEFQRFSQLNGSHKLKFWLSLHHGGQGAGAKSWRLGGAQRQ